MSLASLFIATDEVASTIGKGIRSLPAAEQRDVKGLNDWLLSTLWCLLMGKQPDDSLIDSLMDEFEFVYEESEGGPWICRVPPKLVEQLSILLPHEIRRLAAAWCQTPELKGITRPQDAEDMLTTIIHLSEQGKREGKDLFLWMSL